MNEITPEELAKQQEEQAKQMEEEKKRYEKEVALLKKLGQLEEFRTWRSLVVEENLKALKKELSNPLGLSEAELKAKLLQYNSLETYFYGIFEQIDSMN